MAHYTLLAVQILLMKTILWQCTGVVSPGLTTRIPRPLLMNCPILSYEQHESRNRSKFFFGEWLLKCLDIKFSTILHEIWVLTLLQVILPLPWFCPSLISLFVFINSKIRLTCVRSNIIFYLKIIWYLYVINLYLIHPNYICK